MGICCAFLEDLHGMDCLVYVYALSIVGILVSSLPLVFLFDLGPESLFTFLSFPFNAKLS